MLNTEAIEMWLKVCGDGNIIFNVSVPNYPT